MRALVVLGVVLLGLTGPAQSQSPDQVLAARWATLCPGATPGSALAARCNEILTGGPGSSSASAAGNFLGEIPGQGRAATRDGSPDDSKLRTELGAGWAVFLGADVGRLKRRDGINEAPFDGDTGAVSAGVDWSPGSDWRLGLVLNHSRDDLDFLASNGSTRARFTGLIGLGGWNFGDQVSLDGYAGQLGGDYRLRRAIEYSLLSGVTVSSLASASPDADRQLGGLGLTWSLPRNGWDWQLGGGWDWQRTEIDPYTESGGDGLALFVPGRAITSSRGRLDVALARSLSTGWGVWQPIGRLGWRHEFSNPSRPLSVRFAEDPVNTAIVFDTDDADRNWGELGLGAVFILTGGHSGFVEYRQRVGHDFLQERLLSVGWRIELP